LRRQKREPKKGDRKVTSTAPLASGLDIDGAKHALRNPINLPSGSQLCRTKNGKALKLATPCFGNVRLQANIVTLARCMHLEIPATPQTTRLSLSIFCTAQLAAPHAGSTSNSRLFNYFVFRFEICIKTKSQKRINAIRLNSLPFKPRRAGATRAGYSIRIIHYLRKNSSIYYQAFSSLSLNYFRANK
jgi:hypothetical protein